MKVPKIAIEALQSPLLTRQGPHFHMTLPVLQLPGISAYTLGPYCQKVESLSLRATFLPLDVSSLKFAWWQAIYLILLGCQ